MKKRNLIIGIFIAVIVLVIALFGILIYNLSKNDDSKISDIQVNTDDIDVSIFTSPESNVEVVEEVSNYGDASVTIDGEDVKISLGPTEILKKSYVHLKDEFYLIEALIAKKEDLPIRNDVELSTSYDNCLFYAKVWYLYNKETKERYLVEDNLYANELSLNPKIVTVDGVDYFEFDKMFNYAQLTTDVNHYSIELSEFLATVCSGQGLNLIKYSTIDKPSFSIDDEVASIETSKDLNKDGKVDSIILKTYDNYNDFNKCGYALKINDAIFTSKVYGTVPIINFIDIDKSDSYTEILLYRPDEDAPDANSYDIYYYDGKDIKLVFSGTLRGYHIDMLKDVNEVEFGNGNGEVVINCMEKDTTQTWNINRKYKLDKNHCLYEDVPVYYENLDEQEVMATTNIVLYNSMDNSDISDKIIHSGQYVTLEGTSLDYWIVVGIEGVDYYVELDKYGKINELDLYPTQAFSNINAVD